MVDADLPGLGSPRAPVLYEAELDELLHGGMHGPSCYVEGTGELSFSDPGVPLLVGDPQESEQKAFEMSGQAAGEEQVLSQSLSVLEPQPWCAVFLVHMRSKDFTFIDEVERRQCAAAL